MQPKLTVCPVCRGQKITRTVTRPKLPAMQNRVYRSLQQSITAKSGPFALAVCSDCGFAFNSEFDSALLQYDQDYDNSVPSAVTANYYQEIARYLNAKYLHDDGFIVDIGCGKGTFLTTLCPLFPNVRGLGIDPSYEGPEQISDLSIRFIRDLFVESQITERPDLVICRHVLEHIEQPVEFLKSVKSALKNHPGVPVFFEVPDLGWIIRNQAFWDFCYEHCNYFTVPSLTTAMRRSGFANAESRTAFGDQYLWIEAINGGTMDQPLADGGEKIISEVQSYVERENALIAAARHVLLSSKHDGWKIAIWGMATKGVLYSCLVDPERHYFDFCVDVNRNKHGCFVPTTGHRIDSPEILKTCVGQKLLIVVMNPNYLDEIKATCSGMQLSPKFINASGASV